MSALVSEEVAVFCIMILCVVLHHDMHSVSREKSWRLFFNVIVTAIAFQFFDVLWSMFDRGFIPFPPVIHYIVNCLYFVAAEAMAFYWYYYSEYIQDSRTVKGRRNIILSCIPFFILVLLITVNHKTSWIFYVDSANKYHRGNFHFLQEILSYGYVAFTGVKTLVKARNKANIVKRGEYRMLASFLLFPCIFGGLQLFLPSTSLVNIGITLGIVQVYLNSLENMISLDPLTRLNNRSQLFRHLSGKMKVKSERKKLYLLMMDVDYFKSINDKYGHVEGDYALVRVAETLKRVCGPRDCFVCRYGGDEFIVVCEAESPSQIELLQKQLERELENANKNAGAAYDLSLSIGCACYNEEMRHIPDFIDQADQALYQVKKNRHRLGHTS